MNDDTESLTRPPASVSRSISGAGIPVAIAFAEDDGRAITCASAPDQCPASTSATAPSHTTRARIAQNRCE